jgi:hypothetical protein
MAGSWTAMKQCGVDLPHQALVDRTELIQGTECCFGPDGPNTLKWRTAVEVDFIAA